MLLNRISILFLFVITVLNLSNNIRILVGIYFAVLMYVIGYKFIKDKEVKTITETESPKIKYEKSGLDHDKKLEIKEKQADLLAVAIKAIEEEREMVEKERQEAELKAKEAEAGQPDKPITPPDPQIEAIDEKALETPEKPETPDAKKKGNSNPAEGDK